MAIVSAEAHIFDKDESLTNVMTNNNTRTLTLLQLNPRVLMLRLTIATIQLLSDHVTRMRSLTGKMTMTISFSRGVKTKRQQQRRQR